MKNQPRIFLTALIVMVVPLLALSLSTGAAAAGEKVTDLLGREMTVVENPQRIVALAPSITEIVYALGQEARLVGVTQYSDYPEAAAQLPKVGSYVHLDLERIVSLQPDLCIGVKDGNPKDVVDRLDDLQVPVFVVNPRDLQSVLQTLTAIGGLLQVRDRADAIVSGMQSRIEAVERAVSTSEKRPSVFFQIGVSPIVSVGTHTFINELIVKAGGRNLAAGEVAYPRYSREQVLGMAPDVIVITSMARHAVFEQVLAEWKQWPHIPAVRDGRIFMQDSNLFDRPTPRLVDGLELLAGMIHPELFEEGS